MSDSFWPQKKKDPKSDINLVNKMDWCLDFGATNLTKKLTQQIPANRKFPIHSNPQLTTHKKYYMNQN